MFQEAFITQKHPPLAYTKYSHPILALWIIHALLFLVFWSRCEPACNFLGILQVLRSLLPKSSLSFSTPIKFTRHSWVILRQKSRVASTLSSCQKCPHARLVFTSIVAKYHEQFLSYQNLVAVVISYCNPLTELWGT